MNTSDFPVLTRANPEQTHLPRLSQGVSVPKAKDREIQIGSQKPRSTSGGRHAESKGGVVSK